VATFGLSVKLGFWISIFEVIELAFYFVLFLIVPQFTTTIQG